jgi:hypothetical protein
MNERQVLPPAHPEAAVLLTTSKGVRREASLGVGKWQSSNRLFLGQMTTFRPAVQLGASLI